MGEGGAGSFDRTPAQRDRQQRIANRRIKARPQASNSSTTNSSNSTFPKDLAIPTIPSAIGLAGLVASTGIPGNANSIEQPPTTIEEQQGKNDRVEALTFTPTTSPLDIVTYEANTAEHEEAIKRIDKQAKLLKYDINDQVTPHYEQTLAVVQKHMDLIIGDSEEYGIPPEITLSLVMVENGGGEFEVNELSGAKGMWQLKIGAAKDMGLVVSEDIDEADPTKDERLDPEKATNAALGYLRRQIDYFGDYRWGIASYHSGVTNICDFVYQWATAHNRHQTLPKPNREKGVTLPQIETFARFVRMNHLSPHKVFTDPTVIQYVESDPMLDNDSLIYNAAVGGARKNLEKDKVLGPKETAFIVPPTELSYPKPRKDGAVV